MKRIMIILTFFAFLPMTGALGAKSLAEAKHQEANRQTGTVKFFNESKGFGFIARNDGGADVFVHSSALDSAGLTTLKKGQRVRFRVEDQPFAQNIIGLEDSPAEVPAGMDIVGSGTAAR